MSVPPLAWKSDVLTGFETAPLGDATLVRRVEGPSDPDPRGVIVHVHGYNDYFFHAHVAHEAAARGYAYYAVDCARVGRSWAQPQIPHYMRSVRDFWPDLEAAVTAVRSLHPKLPVSMHAHSTGGLVAALWAAETSAPLDALVLNSPYFADASPTRGSRTAWLVPLIASLAPTLTVHHSPSHYAQYLRSDEGGAWDFDTSWKRPEGLPVRAGWLYAARSAQARIRAGLTLPIPVFVGCSATSGPDSPTNPRLGRQDTIVDVEAIRELSPHLGAHVTVETFADAVHDLTLSMPAVRARYFEAMFSWLDTVT